MSLAAPSRRGLIGAGASLLAARALPARGQPKGAQPFTLGVASGDPVPDGFVIWTRLAPDPLAPNGNGGMRDPTPVVWEIGADQGMRGIVRRGHAVADPRFAHSAHVEVAGLEPGRPYWFRFTALGEQSPVGKAMTAPRPGQPLDRLRFSFASCSNWEKGFFSAYRHMAAEDPDLVIFLGDYIYEGSVDPAKAQGLARRHQTPDPVDLTGYRLRYAAYHTDPDLQAVHAAAPCLMTWDDHEVENDYADQWSEHPSTDPAAFLLRRAAAYRAYWEHMPLRWRSLPKGPNARVYDRFRFGDLAEVSILDGRQYRSMEACPRPDWRGGHVVTAECTERDDPRRTMLGFEQERWLTDGFRHASARWNLVAQDLLVAAAHQKDAKTGEIGHWTDAWDGYPACRTRVLKAVADSRLSNPVFLGGDIHSFWTTDLKADFDDPSSATVATEFVGTSITSDGPDYDLFMSTMPMNPHVKFFDSRVRGYVSCDLRPDRLETAFRTISDRADPNATVSTLKRFVVESGRAGATEA